MKMLIQALYRGTAARLLSWLQGITADQFSDALRVVNEADELLPGSGRGEEKRAHAQTVLVALWRGLKPVAINLLIEIAVSLVRRGITK